MIKISGNKEEVDNFIEALQCPVHDNVGTLKECGNKESFPNMCIKCVLETYKIELNYEDGE